MIDNALIEQKISASPPLSAASAIAWRHFSQPARKAGITLPIYVEVNYGRQPLQGRAGRARAQPGPAYRRRSAPRFCRAAGLSRLGAPAMFWRANGIECPTITGGGTGSFEFESVSGVYTKLQCGSYIVMDADYGRNLDRDGAPTKAFEPSLFV
jgi:D-serine deaminase-like pyridoxal phosphate-dependent protein